MSEWLIGVNYEANAKCKQNRFVMSGNLHQAHDLKIQPTSTHESLALDTHE